MARVLGVLAAALLIASPGMAAAGDVLSTDDVGDARKYWTPERLKESQPKPFPRFSPDAEESAPPEAGDAGKDAESVEAWDPAPPTIRVRPRRGSFRSEADGTRQGAVHDDGLQSEPKDVQTLGADFSSSRLIGSTAHTTYPYSTVGRLEFTDRGRKFHCSASVISKRIVLTAGHCVHNGNAKECLGGSNPGDECTDDSECRDGGRCIRPGGRFFENFLFYPAFKRDRDNPPFGKWEVSKVFVTESWANGGGTVPNKADFAMLEMKERSINRVRRRIADITGSFGFLTLKLCPNHAHQLGYPGNLDDGLEMHQVTSACRQKNTSYSAVYGSDMSQGSSGGPWVQNFGLASTVGKESTGTRGYRNPAPNHVIGVTSFVRPQTINGLAGPPVDGLLGSSIPGSEFTALFKAACANNSRNCK